MALATRCPNCQALFRVAPDQLKLRGGLVRCGACRHVFDAIGTLSYVDDAALATAPPEASPTVGAVIAAIRKAETSMDGAMATTAAATADETDDSPAVIGIDRPAEAQPVVVLFEDEAVVELDARLDPPALIEPLLPTGTRVPVEPAIPTAPLQSPSTAAAAAPSPVESKPRATKPAAIESLESQPTGFQTTLAATTIAAPEEPAPSFLDQADSVQRKRSRRWLGAAAVLLALLALAQLAVAFRAEIVAAVPQSRPALGLLCKAFRCTVSWPSRPESLAVVGSELQALPGTSLFELTAVVRNRGQVTLELPAIELTLTDTLNRAVARKVFSPADYLVGSGDAAAQIEGGLAAGADLTVRIAFEARGINAAGFVVYPFYL